MQTFQYKKKGIFRNDVQFLTTFTQLNARLKNFLMGWLLVLGLKECLVECATLCVKSEVMLVYKVKMYCKYKVQIFCEGHKQFYKIFY